MKNERSSIKRLLTSLVLIGLFFSKTAVAEQLDIRHAEGFTVEYHDAYTLVTVTKPWMNARTVFQYALVPREAPRPQLPESVQCIETPVRSFVALSTSYLGQMNALGVLDTLVGHENFKNVNTPEVLKMIDEGRLQEVGSGQNMNIEILMELDPDLIMTHGLGSTYDSHPKLQEVGLPVVLNAAYMENTPLARAEWIKFLAVFFQKEAEAEKIFSTIEHAYQALQTKGLSANDKPAVLVNAPFNGSWWVPGGKSYVATFLRDAGANYLWAEDQSEGSLVVDFEVVYDRASSADVWINPGQWTRLDDGIRADERLAEFRSFQEGRVYNNDARVNEFGGNDYWESGELHPDVILRDLIKIFHPELLPDHELVYYRKLP